MLAGSGEMRIGRRPRAAQAFAKLTLPRPGLNKVLDLWPEERILVTSPISVLGQLHPVSDHRQSRWLEEGP